MQVQIKNEVFELRRLDKSDLEKLIEYLQSLSFETRLRFGPHPFERDSVEHFYNYNTNLSSINN